MICFALTSLAIQTFLQSVNEFDLTVDQCGLFSVTVLVVGVFVSLSVSVSGFVSLSSVSKTFCCLSLRTPCQHLEVSAPLLPGSRCRLQTLSASDR